MRVLDYVVLGKAILGGDARVPTISLAQGGLWERVRECNDKSRQREIFIQQVKRRACYPVARKEQAA